MHDIAGWVRQGMDRLQAGQADAALAPLRAAVDRAPRHAEAQHLLGLALAMTGQADRARDHLRAAIDLRPDDPVFCDNWLRFLERHGPASAETDALRTRLGQLDPGNPRTADLALRLFAIAGAAAARPWLDRVLSATATPSEAIMLACGEARLRGGDPEAAVALGRDACRLFDGPGAVTVLAEAARLTGRWQESAAAYRRLGDLLPGDPAPLVNLAHCLRQSGDPAGATDAYARALERQPGEGRALAGLVEVAVEGGGDVMAALWRMVRDAAGIAVRDEAIERLVLQAGRDDGAAARQTAQAVLDAVSDPSGQRAVATALADLACTDAAMVILDRLLAVDPADSDSRAYRAVLDLRSGRIARGWRDYEARWHAARFDAPMRPFPQPRWTGAVPAAGRRVLIWAEQGLGDEILYGSLLRDAMARAPVTLECDPRLAALFSRGLPGLEVVPYAPEPAARLSAPDIAAHLPIGSLGGLMRPDWSRLAALPIDHPDPWLGADPDRLVWARAVLADLGPRPWIGVTWRSRNHRFGPAKSMPLADLAAALAPAGGTLVALQYGDIDQDLAACAVATGVAVLPVPGLDRFHDLDGQAAVLRALDLTVTGSNSTAHLAGALGVPVWTAVPAGAGQLWYWFDRGDRGPWYPTMRLFRQSRPGDWASVLASMAAEIGGWAGRRPGGVR